MRPSKMKYTRVKNIDQMCYEPVMPYEPLERGTVSSRKLYNKEYANPLSYICNYDGDFGIFARCYFYDGIDKDVTNTAIRSPSVLEKVMEVFG